MHRHSPLVIAVAVLLGVAAFESAAPIAKDDLGYLMWGTLTRGEPLAWVSGPEWFTYHRPLNTLVWWFSAQSGLDGALVRWAQVGLWTLFGGTLLWTVRASPRALVTGLLLLLTNQVFIDLLQWRSWITTTGSLAFLALATVALERRVAPGVVTILGMLALGFKEMAAVGVVAIGALRPGYRIAVAVVLAGLVAGSLSSSHKLGLSFVLENLRFHAGTVALFAPAVPVLLAARFPSIPAWTLLVTAGLVVLPNWLVASAVVTTSGLFLLQERRFLPAVVGVLTLPLLGSSHARQYLLEGWAVIVLALGLTGRLRVPVTAWAAMLVLASPSAVEFERQRAALRPVWAKQQDFLRDFTPPAARNLYHPDPAWAWDLDAIYWVRGGATLEAVPPAGTVPVQVGPLSGVWADLQPDQGSGTK